MTPAQTTLETARLTLRAPQPGDAEAVRALAGAREVADTTVNIPHPYEPGMAEEWIQAVGEAHDSGDSAVFAVFLRESGELVGVVGLTIDRRFERAELGYWIGVPFWGRGYATEAAHAVVGYAFGVLGLRRVHATHFTRNPASGRVMQKLGMTAEGISRQHLSRWGRFEDVMRYGILREEWR